MNAIAPVSTHTGSVQSVGFVHSVDPTKAAAATATQIPETIAGTVREFTKFTPGQIIEVEGVKARVHDVTNERLVLKFVNKQK